MAAQSITVQPRAFPAGDVDSPSFTGEAGDTFTRIVLNVAPADLVDPVWSVQVTIFESVDNGQHFTLACGMTDTGRVGRTTAPELKLGDADPRMVGRVLFARMTLSRASTLGFTFSKI